MGFLVFTSVGHFVFSPLLEKENSKTLQLNSCGAIFLAISSRWSISSSSAVAWNDETWPLVTIVFAAPHKCSEHHWSTFNMLAYNLAWHTHIFAQIQYKLSKIFRWVSAIPWFQSTPDPTFAIFANLFVDVGLRGMKLPNSFPPSRSTIWESKKYVPP